MSQLCELTREVFGPCSERIVNGRSSDVSGPLVEPAGTMVLLAGSSPTFDLLLRALSRPRLPFFRDFRKLGFSNAEAWAFVPIRHAHDEISRYSVAILSAITQTCSGPVVQR